MKIIKCSHDLVAPFSTKTINSKKCSATAAMTIVNDDIYCVRSASPDNTSKMPVAFHKMFNYLSGRGSESASVISTPSGSTSIAVHANSLTYHDHLFYLVTRNGSTIADNQVMVFLSDGTIVKKYKYMGEKTIATINYYDTWNGYLRFLISVGGSTKVPYRLVKASGNNLIDVAAFTMLVPDEAFSVGNDSYYDRKTKQLYVTKIGHADPIKNNRIYQYDLSGGLVNKKKYSPHTAYDVNADGEDVYEIEGLCLYEGRMYVCTNSKNNGVQTDSIDYVH